MTTETDRAAPLVWGHGSRVLEAFLEPTCPFCARAYPKLFELLTEVGESRLTLKIRLHSQPWHLFSGIVTRAIIAASTLPNGREAADRVMRTVFAHREDYEFEKHAAGPNLDRTPMDILALIESQSGIHVATRFVIPGLDTDMKWHAKYARQNGIHISPTFMVDGLIAANMGSGDTIEKWKTDLRL